MSGPNSDPGRGEQNFRTPPDFLRACERKFGVKITFDLACTREDTVVDLVEAAFGGPMHVEGSCGMYYPNTDALVSAWPHMPAGAVAWCNPPYARSSAFARVASESKHCRTLMLVPASVGTAWFAEYVHPHALVVFLRPRLTFLQPDGTVMPAPINRDLMLCAYGWPPGVVVCEDWRGW